MKFCKENKITFRKFLALKRASHYLGYGHSKFYMNIYPATVLRYAGAVYL